MLHRHLDLPPRMQMYATATMGWSGELRFTQHTQPAKKNKISYISGVIDKTLLIPGLVGPPGSRILDNKTSNTGLSGCFFCCQRSWLRNWTSYVLEISGTLAVSVLETRRGPGWFSARRRPSNCWAQTRHDAQQDPIDGRVAWLRFNE